MATTIHKMSCPYDCPSTCGLEAEIEDGRLIKVKNDKTHPVSKNGICRKMQHYEQDIYSDLLAVVRMGTTKIHQFSLPIEGGYTSQTIRGQSCLVPDLPSNKSALKKFLFKS